MSEVDFMSFCVAQPVCSVKSFGTVGKNFGTIPMSYSPAKPVRSASSLAPDVAATRAANSPPP